MRRDSFGSTKWFPQKDKDAILQRWPGSLLVAENCYQSFTTRETACDESFKPLRQMLERVVSDARQLHANYLDLRHPEDVVTWARDNPDLVQQFATTGAVLDDIDVEATDHSSPSWGLLVLAIGAVVALAGGAMLARQSRRGRPFG